MHNENELIQAVARGEEYALEILFERHYEGIWKYALVILKNPEDAKEVVNDTFFRAFRYAGQFRGDGLFSAWLYRIAKNLCMNILNRRKKLLKAVSVVGDEMRKYNNSSAPDIAPFIEKLDNLKADYRDVIILKDISGYSMKEMAGIMGRSVPAIKTLHHRAINKLREINCFQ
ncbi:MAG: RNA polymerase sigma factor [Candidatus Eremiobacteraeota bacterium]|nr:RNA polymerase sigma factor [Candidatus Eremiobacteraeota bacterium]